MKKRMINPKPVLFLLLFIFSLMKAPAQIIDSTKHTTVHIKKKKRCNIKNSLKQPAIKLENNNAKIKNSILKNYKF
jgi:hypothetical protein